jgi:hypothetical protein
VSGESSGPGPYAVRTGGHSPVWGGVSKALGESRTWRDQFVPDFNAPVCPRGASEQLIIGQPPVLKASAGSKAGRQSGRGYLRQVRSKLFRVDREQNRLCGIADIGRESEGRALFGRIGFECVRVRYHSTEWLSR